MGELRIEAVLRKVRALRALAGSTTSQHEAETAAAMAEELIAKHRLEEASIGDGAPGEAERPREEADPLYVEVGRAVVWRAVLRRSLSRHYGVATWVHWSHERGKKVSRFNVVGRPSDVAALRYMFAWLVGEISRLSERERGVAGKNAFRVGAVYGFLEAVKRAKEAAEREHARAYGGSAAMVLVGRFDESKSALERAHPNLKNIPQSAPSVRDGDAYQRGQAAGASLHGRGNALGSGGARLLAKGGSDGPR